MVSKVLTEFRIQRVNCITQFFLSLHKMQIGTCSRHFIYFFFAPGGEVDDGQNEKSPKNSLTKHHRTLLFCFFFAANEQLRLIILQSKRSTNVADGLPANSTGRKKSCALDHPRIRVW